MSSCSLWSSCESIICMCKLVKHSLTYILWDRNVLPLSLGIVSTEHHQFTFLSSVETEAGSLDLPQLHLSYELSCQVIWIMKHHYSLDNINYNATLTTIQKFGISCFIDVFLYCVYAPFDTTGRPAVKVKTCQRHKLNLIP